MATLRHTRYQAAVMRDAKLLLLQCSFRDGSVFWMLPGGGREEGEDEFACVAREVLEETGLVVRVARLLSDVPAEPPDGTYVRWRTYECTVIHGEAAPGGGEGSNAELTAVQWLRLDDVDWPADILNDPYLFPQLVRLRAVLPDRSASQTALSNER